MNDSRRNGWCRPLAGASLVAMAVITTGASVASAVPPYEPEENSECHPYGTNNDNCGYYPDPPAGGGGDQDVPTHPDGDPGTYEPSGDCSWSMNFPRDIIKLPGDGIDFGDDLWVGNAPAGWGSVDWSVPNCDWYTAHLEGTLHLDGVSGSSGRVHVSYFDDRGDLLDIRHSRVLHADDNRHTSRAVDMSPYLGANVYEVLVCTEISDDGVDFDTVTCKTRFI